MSCCACEAAAADVLELRAALREEAAARCAAEARAEALATALEALRAEVATQAAQPTALTSLPAPLACAVLLLLPVRERARCAAVCRAWRRFIARERTLWATLDFSKAHAGLLYAPAPLGFTYYPFTSEELLGAAARAARGLRVLDVRADGGVERAALHRVLRGAPALEALALGELYVKVMPRDSAYNEELDPPFDHDNWRPSLADVRDALRALPRGAPLRRVQLSALRCSRNDLAHVVDALRPGALLAPAEASDESSDEEPAADNDGNDRAQAPAGGAQLSVSMLHVKFDGCGARSGGETVEERPFMRALFAAAAAHPGGLHTLRVEARLSAASMAALVDAAVAAPQLRVLHSYTVSLAESPGFAEQMGRLRQLRPDLRIDVLCWKEPPTAAQQA
jgi:hypothetical protein